MPTLRWSSLSSCAWAALVRAEQWAEGGDVFSGDRAERLMGLVCEVLRGRI